MAIEAVQRAQQKPVLFTEVGYHSTADGAIRPWEWDSEDSDMPRALWHRQLAVQHQIPLDVIRKMYWGEEPPKAVGKKTLFEVPA